MAGFLKKIWKPRIVEYPGRRRLDDTSQPEVYDVSRAEGSIIQEGDGFTADNMNNLEDRILAAFEGADSMLSDAFSPEKTYKIGDYAIYENALYKFTAAKTAGTWDVAKVQAVTVAGELNSLNENLGEKLAKSDVANNLTTTVSGKALDARQGKTLNDSIASKISTSDIIDNLTSTARNKPLSAQQGKTLKVTIDNKTSLNTTDGHTISFKWEGREILIDGTKIGNF